MTRFFAIRPSPVRAEAHARSLGDEPAELEGEQRLEDVAGADAGPRHDVVDVRRLVAELVEHPALDRRQRARLVGRARRSEARPQRRCERVEHVFDPRDERRALPDQPVRPGVVRGADRARDREDLATLLHGELRRDQRAAPLRGLHHHRPHRQPGDDTVPLGEMKLERRRAGAELGNERARARDVARQVAVPRGIDEVDAGRHDGDRPPPGVEGSAVGRGVDAAREPAHDGDTHLR